MNKNMRESTRDSYHERMLKVLQHIQKNLAENMDPAELAAVAHFSPPHFQRIFKAMVGESLGEHIRRLRLEWSAHLLICTDRPVTDIAFECGYETLESYSRAFKGMFQDPPSKFRERYSDPNQRLPRFTGSLKTGLKKPDTSTIEVTLEKFPKTRVAYMRHQGSYFECGATWEKLCAWAGPKGLLGPDTLIMGICYDNPEITPGEKIRYEAAISVDESVQGAGEVGVKTLEAAACLATRHVGPYEGLSLVYNELFGSWIPAMNCELLNTPSLEIYRNDPKITPLKDLVTDIHVFIERPENEK